MTPDEALSIVDTKAAGRTRFDGMEPYADEVLAAEVRRLRERMPRWEWDQLGERVWRLFVVVPDIPRVFIGNAFEYSDGTADWRHADHTIITFADNIEEAKRQLLECVQTKAADPKAGG